MSASDPTMKAVGYLKSLPIGDSDSLLDMEVPRPRPGMRDLLVRIRAIAVNPVDCKIRQRFSPAAGEWRILGWDAVAEVVAVGGEVTRFQPGDVVYYAGERDRPGCNAEYQCVDERLVALKPVSLSDAEAAAMPLTAIAAWELLFEHLQLRQTSTADQQKSAETLLVVGAAGGVGSILLQLAKSLTAAAVIATAGRAASRDWVQKMGADHVIDHTSDLEKQVAQLDLGPLTHVASLTHTAQYFETYIRVLQPFGRIAMIDDPATALNVMLLKPKSQSLHIEFMFARSLHQTADMNQQGLILERLAHLIDAGQIKPTLGENLGRINAENLKQAHARLESGHCIGKLVLEGFD